MPSDQKKKKRGGGRGERGRKDQVKIFVFDLFCFILRMWETRLDVSRPRSSHYRGKTKRKVNEANDASGRVNF